MQFLILLAQAHEHFRRLELEALAEFEHIAVDLSDYDLQSPFLVVDLPSEDHARRLVRRSFLTKAVYRLFSEGATESALHEANRSVDFSEFLSQTFKVEFDSFQGSRSEPSRRDFIENLAYMGLQGRVRLKNPEIRFCIIESYDLEGNLLYLWFTKWVADSDRATVARYDLRKRRYVGTTSFEAELSLVTANIAQLRRNSWVYDPFAGTGSFAVAAAYFGAVVICSDIDVRPLKKYDLNFEQYGTRNRLADTLAMDFTHNALRETLKLDAIICDPPYGVRERIVVCGAAKPEKFAGKEHVLIDNVPAHLRKDYIPTKRPYELSRLLADLLQFASDRLVPGGRLAFWLPLEDDDRPDIPLHKHLRFLTVGCQKFNKWERWLLVYERRLAGEEGPEQPVSVNDAFHDRYFHGFRNI